MVEDKNFKFFMILVVKFASLYILRLIIIWEATGILALF